MCLCVCLWELETEFWKCQPATRENEVHYMATAVDTNSSQQKGTTVSKLPQLLSISYNIPKRYVAGLWTRDPRARSPRGGSVHKLHRYVLIDL